MGSPTVRMRSVRPQRRIAIKGRRWAGSATGDMMRSRGCLRGWVSLSIGVRAAGEQGSNCRAGPSYFL